MASWSFSRLSLGIQARRLRWRRYGVTDQRPGFCDFGEWMDDMRRSAVLKSSIVFAFGMMLAGWAVAHAAPAYALASERERDRDRATFDGLTGLYTPRAFRDALREELGSTRLTTRTLALWFIDTDDFKAVNDSLGHAAGDRVLLALAELLRAHLIPDFDLPGRSGGDEFCAILRNAGKASAIERAQRFCDRVRMHDFGIGFSLSVSVGVAAFPYDASSANELLEIADAAMYHSKRTGRDRVSFHAGRGFRVNA